MYDISVAHACQNSVLWTRHLTEVQDSELNVKVATGSNENVPVVRIAVEESVMKDHMAIDTDDLSCEEFALRLRKVAKGGSVERKPWQER
jgi:hypothetical protein